MIEEPRSQLEGNEVPDVLLSQFVVFLRPEVRLDELTVYNTLPSGHKGAFREWIESLVFTIIFVLVFTSYIAQATQVPTESMKPTIMVGDHFFLDKVTFPANYPSAIRRFLPHRTISRLDIIAFKSPTDGNIPFVKRVIGLPGETLEDRAINGAGYIYVNGKKLDEPYIQPSRRDAGPTRTWHVAQNHFFMMGDNRASSCDSRTWGSLPAANVLRRVTKIVREK